MDYNIATDICVQNSTDKKSRIQLIKHRKRTLRDQTIMSLTKEFIKKFEKRFNTKIIENAIENNARIRV